MATIQGVYVALFGRPADPAGLAYFNTATSNGANLTAIGDLAATAEYQDRFDGMNNIAVINTIYQGLFGRDADAAGLSFFVAALQSGSLNINNIAIAILDGAQGDDALIVANKLVAANAFTAAVDTNIEIASYSGTSAAALGVSFLAGITADTASIPDATATATAVQGVVDAGVAGNTLTIVDGDNVSVGGAVGFATTANNDTITVTDTYTAAGTINGGFGTDTLVLADVAAAVAPTATSIVSVEKLFVTSTNAAAALDLTAVAGLTQVWNDGSATALTVSGLDKDVTVGFTGTVAGATTVSYVPADIAGTADAATITLDTATVTGTVNVAGIEALTVNVAGVSSLALNAADAETISVTGAGKLTLGGTFAADTTVDASAHTGQFVFTTGVADGLTVIGGASNDTFNVTANAEGVHLTGGAGSDLFNIAAITNIDSTVAADVTADIITITDFNGSVDTLKIDLPAVESAFTNVDLANIAGATTLAEALAVVGAVTDANAADSYATFTYAGSTYIYSDVGHDGFNGGDGLVQLVGFTGELTATNFVAA